jgi:intracellular sulfur oxidation DsrE/DsrF family protein
LDQAINAALATQDSPVVLVIKDTQVSQVLQGSPLQADIRDGLANRVQMFVCEADLVRYGISTSKLIQGLSVIKVPVPKSDTATDAPVDVQPLHRFQKQAEKVCDQ